MTSLQQRLLAFITFCGGIYFFLSFILPKEIAGFQFTAYDEEILKGVQVIGVMSLGLGAINIFSVYGRNVIRGGRGRLNSFALLFGFVFTLGVLFNEIVQSERVLAKKAPLLALSLLAEKGLKPEGGCNAETPCTDLYRILSTEIERLARKELYTLEIEEGDEQTLVTGYNAALSNTLQAGRAAMTSGTNTGSEEFIAFHRSLPPLQQAQSALLDARLKRTTTSALRTVIFEGFFVPLSSAIFALLAFYIATAAYRAFRIRTLESSVMMLAALVVILGQIPHGPLYLSESLPRIRLWLLENISTPAFRAIYFGSTVAGLAMATRMWLSLGQRDSEGKR